VDEVAQNLFSVCCHNGLGVTKGTIAAVVAAAKASGMIAGSLMTDFIPQDLSKR
jgi:glycine/D-amino acid oxidase-like deaminating enzyme